VSFALPRDVLEELKTQFPGVYFHCRDNGNHDHPFSHVVTQLGTRFLQRRCKPGANVLDVYGNANACDRFNHSQLQAAEPKHAKALFKRFGPSDFIREVNKMGPFFDDEVGERYHRGTLRSMIDSDEIAQYDVLQMIHTLYYVEPQELCDALHAPGRKRVALCLVHRHDRKEGTINMGEQSYAKNDAGLVKQVNVKTNSVYVHPDITPMFFCERKEWYPSERLLTGTQKESIPTQGFAWECHIVNDETWIIEIVPIVRPDDDDCGVDYCALWDQQEEVDSALEFASLDNSLVTEGSDSVVIATDDGLFVELDICSKPLYSQMRALCVGKVRDEKLISEMVSLAQFKCNPSPLFGGKGHIKCPPDKIYDHVLAAVLVDVEKETGKLRAVSELKPLLVKHARARGLGSRVKDLCMRDLVTVLRNACEFGRDVNRVRKATDPIDIGLAAIQGWAK